MDKNIEKVLDFLFELGTLRNIKRGWNQLSGSKFQNLTEHNLRTAWISLILSFYSKDKVDYEVVLKMAFSYLLYKSRCSDFHYVSYQNVKQDIDKAFRDVLCDLNVYKEFESVIKKYYSRSSRESIIVYTANGLENRLELMELGANGDEVAKDWGSMNDKYVRNKLKLSVGKDFWDEIVMSSPYNWHLSSKNRFGFEDKKFTSKKGVSRDIDFLYEIGSLRRIPRTWVNFVGDRFASLAEHSFRVVWFSILLSKDLNEVDLKKVIMLAMIHDIAEIRSGDANYVTKNYLQRNQRKAIKNTFSGTIFEKEMINLFEEFESQETLESKIVRDADFLEPLLELKEQENLGLKIASKWLQMNKGILSKKLKCRISREYLKCIIKADPYRWHLNPENINSFRN